MKFNLFSIFTVLCVLIVASEATVSPQEYWKTDLPTTAMPKAITTLLPSPGQVLIPENQPFVWNRPALENQLLVWRDPASENISPNDPYASLFILEKDMHEGKRLEMSLTKTTAGAYFLPRNIAESVPFSSEKMSQILNKLSIKSNTPEAKIIGSLLKSCEKPPNVGEVKYCATSLESMIDFNIQQLGPKIDAITTSVQKETKDQKYTILGVKKLTANEAVVCHKTDYAYAVFYCHKSNGVEPYTVSLADQNGAKAKAAVMCHMDTSSWHPKSLGMKVLGVKPGGVPVCHFIQEGDVLWVPSSQGSYTM